MEPVPVVKKGTNIWLWVVAVVAILLIGLWLVGAFGTRTGTTAPGTGIPGAQLAPSLEAPVTALIRPMA